MVKSGDEVQNLQVLADFYTVKLTGRLTPYLISFIALLGLNACSSKYETYRSNYQFRSADKKPVYASLDYWSAHPWKWDPSDSVPEALRGQPRDSIADVF